MNLAIVTKHSTFPRSGSSLVRTSWRSRRLAGHEMLVLQMPVTTPSQTEQRSSVQKFHQIIAGKNWKFSDLVRDANLRKCEKNGYFFCFGAWFGRLFSPVSILGISRNFQDASGPQAQMVGAGQHAFPWPWILHRDVEAHLFPMICLRWLDDGWWVTESVFL